MDRSLYSMRWLLMCDRCYRAGIPKLPYELAQLQNRGVIKDWQLNPQVGWRVKLGSWGEWMNERDMQKWLDTELPGR